MRQHTRIGQLAPQPRLVADGVRLVHGVAYFTLGVVVCLAESSCQPAERRRFAAGRRGASPYRSSTSASARRAGSCSGRTSATHAPAFHAGTGVGHWSFGTKRDRSTSFILWM